MSQQDRQRLYDNVEGVGAYDADPSIGECAPARHPPFADRAADPGYRVLFERELAVEVRHPAAGAQGGKPDETGGAGQLELISARIFIQVGWARQGRRPLLLTGARALRAATTRPAASAWT